MARKLSAFHRNLMLMAGIAALSACGSMKDWDMRGMSGGFTTSGAAQRATFNRPKPDNRGVISYPGYQVVVARQGDTVASIANRLNLSPGSLARYNAIGVNTPLNTGAVIALPTRVAEPSAATGASTPGPLVPSANGSVDITQLASGAINRAQANQNANNAAQAAGATSASIGSTPLPTGPSASGGSTTATTTSTTTTTAAAALPKPMKNAPHTTATQPIKHKVKRGETAYSIARLYNVPVRALADWNGLGPNLSVHEGQVLLIPVVDPTRSIKPVGSVSGPGQQSNAPEPPSASQPLPATTPAPASAPVAVPSSGNLGQARTSASASQMLMPVSGMIIRPYVAGKHEGIDIAANAGTAVQAASDGTVATVTSDVKGAKIVVIRHKGGLLSVYKFLSGITVKKGDTVTRGQTIGRVAQGNPSEVFFAIFKGANSVDPTKYIQ